METTFISGFLLVALGGIFSGTFSVPFKFNKGWVWENNWLIWSIIALVVAPWVATFITVPDAMSVYGADMQSVLIVALFGLVWGIGAITFGKGIDMLGIALAIPIMQGLNNVIGTLMPIIIKDLSQLGTPAGLKLCAGVAVIVAGIILYSLAGGRRDNLINGETQTSRRISGFGRGFIVCLIAGVFGPMINLAFVYGEPIQAKAVEMGASQLHAANPVWCIALSAGFIINMLYCIYLLRRRGSCRNYKKSSPLAWALASVAGLIWFLSIMFYGMGSNRMGDMGSSIGWATMQSLAIITGNVAGILAGEWKSVPRSIQALMYCGLALLICGIMIIAF